MKTVTESNYANINQTSYISFPIPRLSKAYKASICESTSSQSSIATSNGITPINPKFVRASESVFANSLTSFAPCNTTSFSPLCNRLMVSFIITFFSSDEGSGSLITAGELMGLSWRDIPQLQRMVAMSLRRQEDQRLKFCCGFGILLGLELVHCGFGILLFGM
ncbi:hypothetical protein Hanom_Chr17g01530291 [Helianthus anomalus]